MAVGDGAGEDGRDDERAVDADGADGVVEDALVVPLFEGFGLGLGEAEVDLGAEHLVDAHVAVGGEELLGAEEAEGVFEVGGHGILPAFAASEGEDGDAGAEAAGVVREHAAVFVVRVGDDEHKRGACVQPAQHLREAEGVVGLAVGTEAAVDGELAAIAGTDALAGEVGGVSEMAAELRRGEGRLGAEDRRSGCGEEGRKSDGRESVHRV